MYYGVYDLWDATGLENLTSIFSTKHLIVNVKVEPGSLTLSETSIVPPSVSTICLQMFSPNPIPLVLTTLVFLILPNRVKSFDLSSYLIPMPVSFTVN